MAKLYIKNIPSVSKEFALSLRDRFKPITLEAGIDRDKLMISIGEQNIINFILNNIGQVKTEPVVEEVPKEDTIQPLHYPPMDTTATKSLFTLFRNRYGN